MSMIITPGQAREELAIQHGMLREMIERCEALADDVDAGSAAPDALLGQVARLRAAFDEHNRFEEQVLQPLLLDADCDRGQSIERGEGAPRHAGPRKSPWGNGAVRVSRMVEDHIEEHRAMRQGLRVTPTAELRDVLANLRAHLTAEERYLLSRKVLRDDLDG